MPRDDAMMRLLFETEKQRRQAAEIFAFYVVSQHMRSLKDLDQYQGFTDIREKLYGYFEHYEAERWGEFLDRIKPHGN